MYAIRSYYALFPCLVKPALGGGGKAMRVAGNRSELLEAVEHTARESLAYFGTGLVTQALASSGKKLTPHA